MAKEAYEEVEEEKEEDEGEVQVDWLPLGWTSLLTKTEMNFDHDFTHSTTPDDG